MTSSQIFLLGLQGLCSLLVIGVLIYYVRKVRRSPRAIRTPPSDEQVTKEAGEVMRIAELLDEQAQEGFTEVIMRNPNTGDEQTLKIPTPWKKE